MVNTINLYYEQKQSKIIYSDTPTGMPNVNRLIRGLRYWAMPSAAPEKKQKKLIIANTLTDNWPQSKRDTLFAQLGELLAQGFSIYSWHDGALIPFDEKATSFPEATFGKKNDIIAAAATLRIAKNEVHLLDNHALRQLITPEKLPERFLYASDFKKPYTEKDINRLIALFLEAEPPLRGIVCETIPFAHDTQTTLLYKIIAELAAHYPNVRIINQHDTALVTDYSPLNCARLKNLASKIKNLELNNNAIQINEDHSLILPELEKLSVYYRNVSPNFFNPKQLQVMLNAAAKLKYLHVKNREESHLHFEWNELNLPQLTSFILEDDIFNLSQLKKIIGHSLHLKNLIFNHCELTGTIPADLDLVQLEQLKLEGSSLSWDQLTKLLACALHSTILNLESAILDDGLKLISFTLTKLKLLKLTGCVISYEQFEQLISIAPNLEQLDLTYSPNKIIINADILKKVPKLRILTVEALACSDDNFAKVQLDYLESLVVNDNKHNKLDLGLFLKVAPNLNVLDFFTTDLECSIIEPAYLTRLTTLTLDHCIISADSLGKLIYQSPHLNHLNLSAPAIKGELPIGLVLPELHSLTLHTITGQNRVLCNLLFSCPNLLSLDLYLCDLSSLSCAVIPLPKLTTLSLRGCRVSGKQFIDLLGSLPHLEKLKIHSITATEGHLPANTLNKLKSVSIDLCSTAVVEAILQHAKNMEQFTGLDLNLTEELHFPPTYKLTQISEFFLDDCAISAANLRALLQIIPESASIKIRNVRCAADDELRELLKARKVIGFPGQLFTPTEFERPVLTSAVTKPTLTETSTDIPHDPARNQDNDPRETPPDLKATNQSKNQGMIIAKLSQYLRLTRKHLALIPRLQKGICTALAHYFHDKTSVQWADFIERISGWDGINCQTAPSDCLDELCSYVLCHTSKISDKEHYLGDNLAAFFAALPHPSSVILYNPWHAITVQYKGDNSWVVYDPNYHGGAKTVTQAELLNTVTKAIGSVISTDTDSAPVVMPLITDPNHFIAAGGLLTLSQGIDTAALLAQLPAAQELSKEALDGLTLRDTQGIPAWTLALRNDILVPYTYALLAQFISKHANHTRRLAKSIEHLAPMRRHQLITTIINHAKCEEFALVPAVQASLVNLLKDAPCLISDQDELKKQLTNSEFIISEQNLELIGDLIQHSTLPQEEKEALKKELIAAKNEGHGLSAQAKKIITELTTIDHSKPFDTLFRTWESKEALAASVTAFCMHTLRHDEAQNKRLVTTNSPQETQGLLCALQKHAQNTHRPLFYVNSPDDLICSAAFVARNSANQGIVSTGPGGPLHTFLTSQAKGQAPILLINYDNFSHDDLVRFNSLIDSTRSADGTPISQETLVLGVLNTNRPEAYDGADFYSRFNCQEQCPKALAMAAEVPELPLAPTKESELTKDYPVINFFNGLDFRERLLGRWVLNKKELVFVEGELCSALAHGAKGITLHNAPWDDKEFKSWWELALATKTVDNGKIVLPEEFKIHRSEGYDWPKLRPLCALTTAPAKDELLLNPSALHDFIQQYSCFDEQLTCEPGLIEQYSKKGMEQLNIHLTRAISLDDWARLLTQCSQFKLRLTVFCSPGVTLPKELPQPDSPTPQEAPIERDTRCAIIESTDSFATIEQYTSKEQWTVIDVSECTPADLFASISGTLEQSKTPHFKFIPKPSYLLDTLAAGKKIILTGRISAELADALAPVLLQRQKALGGDDSALKGELLVISDDTSHLHYIPHHHHQVSLEEKKALLARAADKALVEKLLKKGASLATLRAYLANQNPFQGLESLPSQLIVDDKLNFAHSARDANLFMSERKEQVNNLLSHQPYAFLTGLSGVGKSTFVRNELCGKGDKVYKGIKELTEWLADKDTPGRVILFIDEANLSTKQYSEFEGLFNNPPTLFINGVLHTLSPRHKVIFAGNPVSYGDERILAPFFKHHGNALLFKPLSFTVLYERILKPIFSNTGLSVAQEQDITRAILDCYKTLCSYATTEVLISPRELQMMAILIMHHHRQHPADDLKRITKQIVYEVGAPLVPTAYEVAFTERYKPDTALPKTLPPAPQGLSLIPSRHPIWHTLHERLALRAYRRSSKGLNEAQLYGGLGGLIIEGEPGVGKSQLAIHALLQQGYIKATANTKALNPKKNYFYHLPASMPLVEKTELLIKAFHEGAVVLIDEINSSSLMEELLNELLMGYHGKSGPKSPGFMVIGTQNPITMSGRRAASTALERRLTKLTLPLPPANELITLLTDKGLPSINAHSLVASFLSNLELAKKENLSPEPTLRNLLDEADKLKPIDLLARWKNRPNTCDLNTPSLQKLLGQGAIHEAIERIKVRSLREQLTILTQASTEASLHKNALKAKTMIVLSSLSSLHQLTTGQPILQLIAKQLTAMSYNSLVKKEHILSALDDLQRCAHNLNDWEHRVIDAVNNPQSSLYQALNLKRYGLHNRLFPYEAQTLKKVKKVIAELELNKADHKSLGSSH